MCYPCRCPRRSISCHGGYRCCPRTCCRERSCSASNSRVIFPGEFQKFSDMIPPSFLLKQPESQKAKNKSNSAIKAAKSDSGDKGHQDNALDPEGQGFPSDSRCPCEPECVCEPECPCEPGVQYIPDQCTDAPWYGNNCPPASPMTISMCPQPQWICFSCPGAVCSPVAPIDPQALPAAGVPTKRSPPFNPCTGQIYQCENQQMIVESPNETAQCPPYNQYCQAICYGPPNPCQQFNPSNYGEGANPKEPNQANYQSFQGANMGPGPANPNYLGNGGDGTSQVPQEYAPADAVPQGQKRSNSKREEKDKRVGKVAKATDTRNGPNANQRQQYNQFSYVEGANQYHAYYQFCHPANPYYPQGYNISQGQRKGNELREGKESRKSPTSGQRQQYNRDNCAEGAIEPNRGQINRNRQQNPSVSRSNSQGKRNESRQAPKTNNQHFRGESMDRRRDPQAKQSGPPAGQGVSQSGNRSKPQTQGNESRGVSRSNKQSQYNSQNLREEPIDSRKSSRANSPGKQVPPTFSYRSQSLEPRNESRRNPQPSRTIRSNGDARSKSLGKRNESRENRSGNKPESNLNFYQQNIGMSFGPSNKQYVADYPLLDPIYTTQLESTLGDSESTRSRNETKQSSGRESLPGSLATGGASQDRPNRNCCIRFNPNNQYCPYYISDECFNPPSTQNLRSPREASNGRSQLLNRSKESGSLDGLQMSTKTSKSRRASAANKNERKKCTKPKSCQPTLAEILAKEVAPQPRVLVLETNENGPKKKNSKCPESPDECVRVSQDLAASDSQDQCSCDSQDDISSSESQEDKSSTTVTDKSEEKSNSNAPTTAESPNSCWMRCPKPWPCCYAPCNGPCNGPCNAPCSGPCNGLCKGPYNGRFCYCGNCYNGCRNCFYYHYNPCGGYCCSQPPTGMAKPNQKAPAKPKEKEKQVASGKAKENPKRKKGGVSVSKSGYCTLQPPPLLGFPLRGPSTMPGYYPTAHPQHISPYSRH